VVRPYDPWVAFMHLSSSELWTGFWVGAVILIGSLAASVFYDRFFCKYLCPLGALYGIVSKPGLYRVRRDENQCIDCGLCVNACPAQGALTLAGPKNTKISPLFQTMASVAVFAAVILVTAIPGWFELSKKSQGEEVKTSQKIEQADQGIDGQVRPSRWVRRMNGEPFPILSTRNSYRLVGDWFDSDQALTAQTPRKRDFSFSPPGRQPSGWAMVRRGDRMISILAKNVVRPGEVESFKDLARDLVFETRKEPGCIAYALNEDLKDPRVLTFIERWESQEAIDAHMKSAHFLRIVPQLGPLLAEPGDIRLYREVE